MDYILLDCCPKGPMEISIFSGCCQSYWLLSTNWWYVPIAEDSAYVSLTEHGKVEMVPNYSLYSYWLEFVVLRGTPHATRGEGWPPTQLQTLWSTTVTCLWDVLTQQWYDMVGVTSHYLIRFKAHSMKWTPCLILVEWPRTWDWIDHGPHKKLDTIVLLKEHNKMIPNNILL